MKSCPFTDTASGTDPAALDGGDAHTTSDAVAAMAGTVALPKRHVASTGTSSSSDPLAPARLVPRNTTSVPPMRGPRNGAALVRVGTGRYVNAIVDAVEAPGSMSAPFTVNIMGTTRCVEPLGVASRRGGATHSTTSPPTVTALGATDTVPNTHRRSSDTMTGRARCNDTTVPPASAPDAGWMLSTAGMS